MKSPILFITFNRPDKTARVFDVIKEYKPERLYLASDGPRKHKQNEDMLVLETRKIISQIDWPCEVKKLYRDENLGCKKAVSSAITWFFEQEEMGIILEDDCLPNISFFEYSNMLLKKYKNDADIYHINGTNLLSPISKERLNTTYYFSKNIHVWGWASWRRAWNKYSLEMDELRNSKEVIASQFADKKIGTFWYSLFNHIKHNNVDTWDAQWVYSIYKNNGLSISPSVNLIENIGFDQSATHTTNTLESETYVKETDVINFTTVNHPSQKDIRTDLDKEIMYRLYIRTFWQKIIAKIKSYQ